MKKKNNNIWPYIVALAIIVVGGIAVSSFEKPYMQVLQDPYSQIEMEEGWAGLELIFGATGQRPTNFKTTLAESLTTTAGTEDISVSSVTTKDGHALTTDDIGDFMCFHVNPGASNDELICCTGGISGTEFVDCTRGYSFYSSSTVAANVKAHSPGETVIISNDDIWLSTQFTSNEDDETVSGDWTTSGDWSNSGFFDFTNRIRVSTSTENTSKIFIGDEGAYLWYNSATDNIGFASSTGNELVWNTSGTTFSVNTPLILSGGLLKLTTSTNDFVLDTGSLSIRKNNSITSNADGLAVSTTTNYSWTGTHAFGDSVTISTTSTIERLLNNKQIKSYTAQEAIVAGEFVYATSTESGIMKSDATYPTSTFNFIGEAITAGSAGETIYVLFDGTAYKQTGLTIGSIYYLSDTAGDISTTPGTHRYQVGRAISATELLLDINTSQTKSASLSNISCNPSASSWTSSHTDIILGFRPNVVWFTGLATCTGDSGNALQSLILHEEDKNAGVQGIRVGATSYISTSISCSWTGGGASSTIQMLENGFRVHTSCQEGGTYAGSAAMTLLGYTAFKF